MGMVSAGHHLAASAGHEMLANGGNAIDAGVAAGLVVNVVHHDMTNFGGVAPIIIRSAETDRVHTISGVGRWPRSASREFFETEFDGAIPRGITRSVVPGAPDAWITALRDHGRLSFAEVAAPAIRFAREGYPVYEFQRYNMKKQYERANLHSSTLDAVFPHGRPPAVGEILTQRALADTLERMAEEEQRCGDRESGLDAARDYFYEGPIARKIDEFSRERGGLIRKSDLADFTVQTEPPVHVEFGDYDVFTCGPWCQGPVLAQSLNIAEERSIQELEHNSPEYLHLLIEVLKLAFADREWYYGDPDTVDVPIDELVSERYTQQRAEEVSMETAHPELPPPGITNSVAPDPFDLSGLARDPEELGGPTQDTSYVAAIDDEGNVFSATPSDSWHQSPIVPELGIVVSGRGSQSRLDPRHPNSLEPWKRPRLTPNPALVLKDGEPYMALGTPGGDVQPQAMVQVLLNHVVFGMSVQQAIEAPRVATYSHPASFTPHQYYPGTVMAEARLPAETFAALEEKGHRPFSWPSVAYRAGGVNVVTRNPETGVLEAGADFRRGNYAVGE